MFNKKDHILRKRGVLSQKDCDYLIDYFESHQELHFEGFVDGRVNPQKKIDTEISLDFRDKLFWIKDYLEKCIEEYKKEYPHVNKLSFWSINPLFKLQKYKPNEGYFVTHCENTGPDPEGLDNMDRRVLAWMIYLNDVREGGYTEFPAQNKKFKPRRGDILIWPAYFTHPHRGIVSKRQKKYIVTGWYVFDS